VVVSTECVRCQMYDEYITYGGGSRAVAVVVVVSEQLGCRVSEQQPGERVCEGRRFVWLMASLTALDITVLCVILCSGAG
jgi:hypothetical protein